MKVMEEVGLGYCLLVGVDQFATMSRSEFSFRTDEYFNMIF